MESNYKTQSVPVLIISGSVGVGKTSVAYAISETLKSKALPHAVIDVDCLTDPYPRPKDDPFNNRLLFKNLASIWKNYKEAGIKYLIIPRVIEARSDLGGYMSAIPNAKIILVRLRAKLEEIHRRLKARESSKSSLEWHLKRAVVLNDQLEQSRVEDFAIDNDNKNVNEIAMEILNKCDWLEENSH